MGIKQAVARGFVSVFPLTRFYRKKALIYRWSGFDVDLSSRIVSSARFIGGLKLSIGSDTFIGHETLFIGGESTIRIGNCVDVVHALRSRRAHTRST